MQTPENEKNITSDVVDTIIQSVILKVDLTYTLSDVRYYNMPGKLHNEMKEQIFELFFDMNLEISNECD